MQGEDEVTKNGARSRGNERGEIEIRNLLLNIYIYIYKEIGLISERM